MDESPVENLFRQLLTSWNQRDATKMAALFVPYGSCVGFDGSQMNGRAQIQSELAKVFANHTPASYVWKIREIRALTKDVVLIRAVAGMIPPGENQVMPDRNAIQSVVAQNLDGKWFIALFQNTPAKFDGRPEVAVDLTKELQEEHDHISKSAPG